MTTTSDLAFGAPVLVAYQGDGTPAGRPGWIAATYRGTYEYVEVTIDEPVGFWQVGDVWRVTSDRVVPA